MKDDFANLLVFVLPAGATSGRRLILDGINGRIEAYDTVNDRVVVIDSFRIRAQVSDTGAFVELSPTGTVVLSDAQANQEGTITATTVAGARRLSVRAPYDAFLERASIVLDSDSPSTVRVEADQLEVTSTVAQTITASTDASGFITFNHGASVVPKIVVVEHQAPISGAGTSFCAAVDSHGATTARGRWFGISGGAVTPLATTSVTFRVLTLI